MTEQTFRSPNFFEREIDLSAPSPTGPVGVPAGVIGMANKGPAFVPVSVASFAEFQTVFGDLDTKKFGPYAVNEFLKHRTALTYMRVLGAGANTTDAQIDATRATGRVTNAGFNIAGRGKLGAPSDYEGCVQFLCAKHSLQAAEAYGMPMFTDNDSFPAGTTANLVRGILFMCSGSRAYVIDGNEMVASFVTPPNDGALVVNDKFKLIISSTLGSAYSNGDGFPGIRVLTASLNPTSNDYFAKILNTDPERFVQDQHYLYADFAVDNELASATVVGILSGSANVATHGGDKTSPFRQLYGMYNTRYTTPSTTWFISQPFGTTEYDLFRLEALDDGEYANKLYKVAISNLKASPDNSQPYGTFTLQIRDWNDTDTTPRVIESFPNCSLDPTAKNYIAKLVGDRKVSFNFDSSIVDERRLITRGKYPNVSKYVRIVMSDAVERSQIPAKALPFGFRGAELLKTNDSLTDTAPASAAERISGEFGITIESALSGSIVPPIPFRAKVTRGETSTAGLWPGYPGSTEVATSIYYWGVKFERNSTPLNPNVVSEKNPLLASFTKFIGIKKLDVLVTGSGADTFNNNKFTLAKVAFSNSALTDITGSIADHMREAAYVRDGAIDSTKYTVNDGVLTSRVSLATLLAYGTASEFNRFSPYAKFVTFMYGGFNGLNILDPDARKMNDKSTSFDVGAGASATYASPGFLTNLNGAGQLNNNVASYIAAVGVMTDPMVVNTNLLAIPGIKEPFVTDYTMQKTRDYGLAMYVMDIPSYSDSVTRLYDDSTDRPDVNQTANQFDSRTVDNNYAATYWPNVFIDDATNKRRVKVPSSVAAMGALAFNDKIAYPWFAPAGFNRAALDFVTNVEVRLNISDRDRLYDSRINPVATYPRLGYVIYGQKTLQINKSALDRVNVRRLLLEIKRIVIKIANNLVFEQNTPEVRNRFTADASLQLGLIKAQSGIETFQVIMNETNNTQEDADLNRLNGRIVVVPTRAIEFILIDFIVTNSGVQFV